MLWKKESAKSDALYVDIFELNENELEIALQLKLLTIEQQPQPKKTNTIALQKRNEGNNEFRNGAIIDAIELYNDSLRYAEPQSQHISLAYANRAACFLSLKMYGNCLKDIELAKQAGYPEHLMAKLDDRHAKCLLEMQNDQQQPQSEALSIESDDPRFPCLANVAKVQRNETDGVYSVVAKADIDVGQTICIERPFSAYIFDRFGGRCNICTKDFVNLTPCPKCAVAMFCPDCEGHFLHEYECGLNLCGKGSYNSMVLGSIRDILLIVELFPNVDELMTFVEQMLRMKPNELPESLSDDRQKFQVLFNSTFPSNDSNDIKYAVYTHYKTIMRIPAISEMFASTKHRRFLIHLIGQLKEISSCEAVLTDAFFPEYDNPIAVFKTVMRKYFQHSCNPNVLDVIRDGKSVVFAVKPIRAGEKLFISYEPNGLELSSTKERQENLWEFTKTKCSCSRCKGKTASPAQRQQLTSDPAYRYFQTNQHYFGILNAMNIEVGQSVMEQCFVILRKYGGMDWCDELGSVVKFFYRFQYFCAPDDVQRPLVRSILSKLSK